MAYRRDEQRLLARFLCVIVAACSLAAAYGCGILTYRRAWTTNLSGLLFCDRMSCSRRYLATNLVFGMREDLYLLCGDLRICFSFGVECTTEVKHGR